MGGVSFLPVSPAGSRNPEGYIAFFSFTHPLTLPPFFFCTNPSEAPVAIAVQVLALDGTPINVWSDTSALLGPHTTEVWATDVADGLSVDQFQNMGIGMLNYGSAQILATSARIACSAFIADRYSNPPASMTTLSMVKGKQQKGD